MIRELLHLCHTLRGCVDWNNRLCDYSVHSSDVTPCVGVWIETVVRYFKGSNCESHTLRGCVDWNTCIAMIFQVDFVTPCVGVWIETGNVAITGVVLKSHPAWVCGLKPITRVLWKYSMSHTLRGCVDWNIRTMTAMYPYVVTPCVGVWIETTRSANFSFKSPCHTLRGCVDWNSYGEDLVTYEMVTPCVGVWIETTRSANFSFKSPCHTLRGCVDWNSYGEDLVTYEMVTPCVGVWIETFPSIVIRFL